MWHSRPPRDPLDTPTFMAKTILNFHFDYLTTSLIHVLDTYIELPQIPASILGRSWGPSWRPSSSTTTTTRPWGGLLQNSPEHHNMLFVPRGVIAQK